MKGNVKKRKQIVLKKTPKIKIAFAIIGIAIGLLLSSVLKKLIMTKKLLAPLMLKTVDKGLLHGITVPLVTK